MNSKIVILDDSVILYQHYISDEAWESVMAFPRGGLTYLIKNNNIKFYAYVDYFYRNCLMTMDLPIYIIDEELGIDGEYDDIEEITEVLNRIFPANDNGEGIDLTPYLKKKEAEETYQPIGLYFDDVEYDSSGKTIDFYSDGALVDSIDATDFIKDGMVDHVELTTLSGDTYLHIVFNTDAGKEPIDINLGDIFDAENYYTKQEVNDLLDDKVDTSAYTPVDLSDYYTKQEVDSLIPEIPSLDGYATESWVENQGYISQIKTINNISLIGEGNIQIGSGGTIDAYTKAEADERFQPKGDYVTTSTFNTYILNLTQQIASLQEAIEECCPGSGETLYRWITLTGPNDYICSGTTKYAKEQKQQSTDNGATWQNVSPAEYRTGTAIESQSTDCGYQPTIDYRWVTVSGGYVCSGTTKYNQEKRQYRIDGGSWIDTDPLETRRGSTVIETQSTDCGYIAPQYRWYQASASDYMCSGTTKYYKEYYQVSLDGGNTWNNVTPVQTRQGSVIETQSTDCGYIAPQYRWYTSQREYLCSGTTKYQKQYYQVSYDSGSTWENVSPLQTRRGSVIETKSTDCGYVEPQYRWYTAPNTDYICSGTTKYQKQYYQVSYNGGSTWQNVSPVQTRTGDVIEYDSTDCGYIAPQYRWEKASTSNYVCVNYDKHYKEYYQVSYDGGSTWSNVVPESSRTSSDIIESNSVDCGYPQPLGMVLVNQQTPWINISGSNFTLTRSSLTDRLSSSQISNITELNVNTECKHIANGTFSGLTKLYFITNLGVNLETIGDNAFNGCVLLEQWSTHDKIRTIGANAFKGTKLENVVLPEALTSIGDGAFSGCSSMLQVVLLGTTPPTLSADSHAFDGSTCSIYVPASAVSTYKNATGWKKYSSRITTKGPV